MFESEWTGSRAARLGTRVSMAVLVAGVSTFAVPDTPARAAETQVVTEQAQSAERVVDFDIPAGGLSAALNTFGRQSGLQVTGDAADVNGREVPAVKGRMTASDALAVLLEGTGIVWSVSDGTVVLSRSGDSAVVLNPITVEGQGESAYGPVEGYSASRSGTGTRTDTSIHETPASIQVVPRDVIEDQNAQSLADVYDNVSGVVRAGNTQNATTEVFPMIRGFEAPDFMRNGMRIADAGAVDLLNAERVEVLKGPASILNGSLEPGGMINMVSKRPSATPAYNLEQQVGSYNYFRSEGEATGKITGDGKLSYRAALAYTDSGSFRENQELERVASGAGLLWQPTDDTEVLFDLAYVHEEQPYDTGVPIGFHGEQLVDDDTSFQDPDLKGRDITDYNANLQVRHDLDKVFSVRNQVLFHMTDAKNESVRPRGVRGTVGNETIRLRFQDEDRTETTFQTNTDLVADFKTGSIEHKALVGGEYFFDRSKFARRRQNLANVAISNDPNVDAGAADFEGKKDDVREGDTHQGALYAQDQVEMLENGRLKLLFGGRYDAVKTDYTIGTISSEDVVDHAFTGRFGALYDVTRNAAVYASYSQSYIPVAPGVVDAGGQPLDPETGDQYEAGVKFQTDDRRFSATASVYQIEKQNVAEYDSVTQAYVRGVDHQSRGIEFDVTGEVMEGLNLLAYYSYTDSEVLRNEDDPTEVGERLGGVPLHKARLWARYNFAENSDLKGWGIGGGARYVGENSAQFDNDVKLDPYVVFDAAAWYRMNDMVKLSLNVKNLLDEHYYVRASDQSIVHPGEPFSVIGSLSMTF